MNEVERNAQPETLPEFVELLSADQCLDVCRQLDAMRSDWRWRDPELPYFTLGAASYLDAADDSACYLRRAAHDNPLLDASFGELYTRLLVALSRQLGSRFVLADEAARPGFHIFEFHPQFRLPVASVHFDRQFEDIPWQRPDQIDFGRPLSFTLALQLPAAGGGLNTWPADWRHWSRQLAGRAQLPVELLAQSLPCKRVDYSVGKLLLHSGHLLHQIAPAVDMQPGDRRITLQGHAVPRGDVYQVYW